jgi:hypothetical protein
MMDSARAHTNGAMSPLVPHRVVSLLRSKRVGKADINFK